jgi:hypothetical protein
MAKNNGNNVEEESISTVQQHRNEYWEKQNQLRAAQYAENSNAIGYWTNNEYEIHFHQPGGRSEYVYTYSYNQKPLAYFEFSFDYRQIVVFCDEFTEDWQKDSEEYKLINDFDNYCATYATNLYNLHQKQQKELQDSFDIRDVTFEERNSEVQAEVQAEAGVEPANGTEESTEQQQGPQETTPPEPEEANGDVKLSDKATKIIESGTIDSGGGFLNGDTASSQDSDIIDLIANALGSMAGAALQSTVTNVTSQLDSAASQFSSNIFGGGSGEGGSSEGSNIISAEELGTDVLTSMEGAAMNVINSSGELSNMMELANTAMNGYETVKNLIKQLPELIPELVLSAVDIITNGILQSIKSNLEAILDPQAIMSQLGYFTSYYTKLYTKGVGAIMSELAMAKDALGSMQLDNINEQEKSKKEEKLKKHKERIEKCKEYASYAQSAVEAIVYYSTEGVPMVQKLMSTYCQWVVKKADKYITMGADWLIDRRDEFIENCGEKIGKKAAEAVNKATEKASSDKLSAAAVKAKAGLLQGMAMIMMGVQIAVAQLGPLLGKLLKMAVKISIDLIKKQIQKAVQDAMKAAIEATQKAIQEAADKATSAISDGMNKATEAISGGK